MRKATAEDREQLARWIAADPYHRDHATPECFYDQSQGSECMVFEDAEGAVFYVRIRRAIRVDIQFAPDSEVNRSRTREMLKQGFSWLLRAAQESGHRQVIFTSVAPRLVAFCKKRLGFEHSQTEYVRDLAPAKEK